MRHFERIPVVYMDEVFEVSGTWDAGEHLVDQLSVFVPDGNMDLSDSLPDTVMEDITMRAAEYLEEDEYSAVENLILEEDR